MKTKKKSRFGANVVNDVEKRKKEGSGFGYLTVPKEVSFFKESEGKLKLDIIPYIVTDPHHLDRNGDDEFAANVGNPWYKKPIWVHRSVGADKQSVICPTKTIGKKCPICEYRDKQKAEGIEKEGLVSYPQLRYLYIVIPVGHKKYEEEFHIWDIANGNFQETLDEELSENPENGVFPDPEEGKTLAVRFSEKTFSKTKYYSASRIDFEDRDPYEESIMDEAPCLDDMVKVLTYKELQALFLEIDEDDVVEEETKREEKVKSGSSFRKKKTVEVEEESEEEEEDDDDETPFKSTRSKKKTVEVEEEEEPEEEEDAAPPKRKARKVEEEEEEEKPSPKKRVRKEPVEVEEDDDDDEVEIPTRRKSRKAVKEEELEDEDDDDDEPSSKKKRSRK